MLDYACGDGVISKALKTHFGSVIGVDVSNSMLKKYEATVSDLGLSSQEMMGVRGDLIGDTVQQTEPALTEEELNNFDLIAVSMALHHFEDPEKSIQRLVSRLKTGGTLLIIDWTPLDGSTRAQKEYLEARQMRSDDEEHPEAAAMDRASQHTISKPDGFTETEMKDLFERGGCTEFRWKLAEELSSIIRASKKSQLFWARATKI